MLHIVILFPIHLHPIMFLLNPMSQFALSDPTHWFTSHYVPIKSINKKLKICGSPRFTSHYVPIKSCIVCRLRYCIFNLHPIMFLLNLHLQSKQAYRKVDLHPIMFLLNYIFPTTIHGSQDLHPIMFLLNRKQRLRLKLMLNNLHPIMFLLNPVLAAKQK